MPLKGATSTPVLFIWDSLSRYKSFSEKLILRTNGLTFLYRKIWDIWWYIRIKRAFLRWIVLYPHHLTTPNCTEKCLNHLHVTALLPNTYKMTSALAIYYQSQFCIMFVLRGSAPFGRHLKNWPDQIFWACAKNSFGILSQSDLSDLTLSMHRVTGSPWIADFQCWTRPEVAILGADQQERGLWGREWFCTFRTQSATHARTSAPWCLLWLVVTTGHFK